VYFSGESQAIKLLRDLAKPGDAGADQIVWQLLLELYLELGLQNEFEETAVDFAVTYEVSPPSWETPPPKPKGAAPAADEPAPETAPEDAFFVQGEVAGANDVLFNELAQYAATANPLVIDMSRTRSCAATAASTAAFASSAVPFGNVAMTSPDAGLTTRNVSRSSDSTHLPSMYILNARAPEDLAALAIVNVLPGGDETGRFGDIVCVLTKS